MSAPAQPDLRRGIGRRAWGEQPVRLWLVAALAVAGITLVFTLAALGQWWDDRDVVVNGQPATATIVQINGSNRAYEVSRDNRLVVNLRVVREDGQEFSQNAHTLSREPGEVISIGDELPVRIRPLGAIFELSDRTEPPPLFERLIVVPGLLAILLGVAAVAWWKWRTITKLARQGVVRPAQVVGLRGTPLAPLKSLVRFAYQDDEADRRIHTLLHNRPAPAAGEPLDVLSFPGKSRPAVAADRYRA
jgi:hypothetical protein